jgi:hypothetical protein
LDAGSSGVQLFIGCNNTFKPSEHLPQMTIGDLLKALKTAFALNLQFKFGEKKLTIKSIKSIIEKEVTKDWTDKASPIEEFEVFQDKNLGFVSAKDPADAITDEYQSEDQISYKNFENRTVLECPLSWPVDFIHVEEPEYQVLGQTGHTFWDIPVVDIIGNSPINDNGLDNSFSPRLFFYRGFQNDHLGRNYPKMQAHNDHFDTSYTAHYTGDYSLRWAAENAGLYDTWWKTFAQKLEGTKLININLNHFNLIFILVNRLKYDLYNIKL